MPYPLGHGATCQISYWVPVKLSLLRPFARLAPANARHYVAPRANWQKGGHLLFFVWGRGGACDVCHICIAFVLFRAFKRRGLARVRTAIVGLRIQVC